MRVSGQTEIVAGLPLLERELKADAFVGRDSYGNLYAIRSNNFIKVEANRTLEFRNVAGGQIAHVDITNPLLIVLFYEAFNTVVLLDNQLNEVRRIDFNTLPGPVIAQSVGLASQNRLWVYDAISLKIGLYDLTRNSFKTISVALSEPPSDYNSDYNHFQWVNDSGKHLSCDVFGKIGDLGTLPAYNDVQLLSDGSAILLIGDELQYMKIGSNTIATLAGVEKSVKKFYFDDQILTIFTDFGITNYKIILP